MLLAFATLAEACASPAAGGNRAIILATTTSTQDSGLLDALHPAFESQTGYLLKTVAVGSGQALKMGEECNADMLLVHAPSAEKELMEKGFGAERKLVMHNDFILVGPADDPAGIKGTADRSAGPGKDRRGGSRFCLTGRRFGHAQNGVESMESCRTRAAW